MNSTNRGANRLVIIVFGLVLMALGAAAILAATPTVVRDNWASGYASTRSTIVSWLQQTPLNGPGTSWLWLIGLAALVVVGVLLVLFITRQGRGHTGLLYSQTPSSAGQTLVDAAVAERALGDSLRDRPEFVTSNVSTYRVSRQPMLKISVTCRRGVSPRDAVAVVTGRLRAFDALFGQTTPALIQVSGGFRARTTRATRIG
ncbi:hypothetical protein [Subtercola endophyticus]|uniref:hypothetical protein n=1 Tax=Subtercola endophyticus TaxID=2895559 RepID=UPI001E5E4940|nr:hypothetical protein [Subtercola endophyticus]UFS58268.1 hypothetical protein LQ955_14775 [Subtercola endophyticus]